MYHVISTGIAAIVLYLISYLFYRTGFYSRYFHRKTWNILLAITFLLTALAGLFLALQINYKWNIPFIKTVLKWHVECGIGLSFTGIIHFIWHFTYYFRPENDTEQSDYQTSLPVRTARQDALNLFLIGVVSSTVQLLFMREMMNIAGGYELITGTFLASWLIGSAAGSAVAKNSRIEDLRKINTAFAISPLLSVVLLIFLTRMMLNPGETPSFFSSIIITLMVLTPFTFISGFAFIRILLITGRSKQSGAGRLFSVETAGGVLAGLIVSVYGSGILNTYQMLLLIITIFIYYVFISFYKVGQKVKIISIPLFLAACFILIFVNPDILFRQLLLPAIKVKGTTDTPYGNITTGEYGGEKSIYYNHHLLKWQNDETEREENIHYALVQREKPENILIVSGDINSNLPELTKYPVKKIFFVENDPELLKQNPLRSGEKSDILQTENVDAFRFINETAESFDMILLILPPPSTLMLNRYYTTDFFIQARTKLRNDGVIMCSPGTGENYFNKESIILYSSVYNSLKSVFRNVVPIVGNKLYYLASDGELTTDICSRVTEKGLSNSYVNQDFLADDLIKMKSEEVLKMLDKKVRPNTLDVPVACFHFQTYNLSKSAGENIPAFVLMILIFMIPAFTIKPKNLVMFSAAGALAGFEIILLLTLQSTAGNMYRFTGLIISGIMAGLALGAGLNFSWMKVLSKNISLVIMFLFYLIAGLMIHSLIKIGSSGTVIITLLIVSLIPSFFAGHLFRLLTENAEDGKAPSGVYSADLAGSAIAFIAVSAIAIPLIGMQLTLFLLSALIFAGLILGTISNK